MCKNPQRNMGGMIQNEVARFYGSRCTVTATGDKAENEQKPYTNCN